MTSPSPPPTPPIPPPFFRSLCTRWASGHATPYDTAVLTSLLHSSPLPPPHATHPVAFDPLTRLPPASSEPLYQRVKNETRAKFHADRTALLEEQLSHALTAPPAEGSIPPTIAAYPVRKALLEAVMLALSGKQVVWHCRRVALLNAGPELVTLIRGWDWQYDLEASEGKVLVWNIPDVEDGKLFRMGRVLAEGLGGGVLPEGETVQVGLRSGGVRKSIARWCYAKRLWWSTKHSFKRSTRLCS